MARAGPAHYRQARRQMKILYVENHAVFATNVIRQFLSLRVLYDAGIRVVVSLLNIPSDKAVCESAGFAFMCLPVPDGEAPTTGQALEFKGRPSKRHARFSS